MSFRFHNTYKTTVSSSWKFKRKNPTKRNVVDPLFHEYGTSIISRRNLKLHWETISSHKSEKKIILKERKDGLFWIKMFNFRHETNIYKCMWKFYYIAIASYSVSAQNLKLFSTITYSYNIVAYMPYLLSGSLTQSVGGKVSIHLSIYYDDCILCAIFFISSAPPYISRMVSRQRCLIERAPCIIECQKFFLSDRLSPLFTGSAEVLRWFSWYYNRSVYNILLYF